MGFTSRELIGITLWWAEGTKSRRDKRWKNAVSYPVEVTNTNPVMIKLFLDFLREDVGFPEEKLRVQLQIHEGDDKKSLEEYWSGITGVEINNFNKTIVRPRGNKPGKTRGTCKVRFADRLTYNRLHDRLTQSLSGLCEDPKSVLSMDQSGKSKTDLLK